MPIAVLSASLMLRVFLSDADELGVQPVGVEGHRKALDSRH